MYYLFASSIKIDDDLTVYTWFSNFQFFSISNPN